MSNRIRACGGGNVSRAEDQCVDEDARDRIEAEAARRRADAEAHARADAHYASGNACTMKPSPAGACRPPENRCIDHDPERTAEETRARAAAEQRDGARVRGIVRPERRFTTCDELAREVLRLREITPGPKDETLRRALASRVADLTRAWCDRANVEGKRPPGAALDPARATPKELSDAFEWAFVGGVIPMGEIVKDGGIAYERAVSDEIVRRTGGRPRPSDDTCGVDPARASQSRGPRPPPNEIDPDQKYIGLDGRQGTAEELDLYERAERIKALNPGTGTGVLGAGLAAGSGGSVEDIRRAGKAGNAAEGMGGIFGSTRSAESVWKTD